MCLPASAGMPAVLAALGQTAPTCARQAGSHRHLHHPEGWGQLALRTALPESPRDRGLSAPELRHRVLGDAFGLGAECLVGSPIVHPPAWGLADCYGRLPYAAVPVLFGPWGPARSIRRSSASLPLARILPPVV